MGGGGGGKRGVPQNLKSKIITKMDKNNKFPIAKTLNLWF